MNIIFINQASLKVLKRSREEMLGNKCNTWNGPLCRTKNCGVSLLKRGIDHTCSERDGTSLRIDVSYLKNAEGKDIGHLEIIQDVTAANKSKSYTDHWVEQVRKNLRLLAEGNLDIDLKLQDPDDHTKNISEEYGSINKDIGHVAESIRALAQDASMMSKAAIEGKLSERVEAGKHKGVYKDIVQGVNDTLEAVVVPINEAMTDR